MGGGNNTWFLAREGFHAFAVDGSKAALSLASRKLRKEKLKADFKQANFMNLPFQDNYFDAVIDEYSTEANTFSDIKTIFREILRVLKPQGKYFGLMLSSECKELMKGRLIEPRTFSATTGIANAKDRCLHFFTEGEIKYLSSLFSDNEINHRIVSYNNSAHKSKYWWIKFIK